MTASSRVVNQSGCQAHAIGAAMPTQATMPMLQIASRTSSLVVVQLVCTERQKIE